MSGTEKQIHTMVQRLAFLDKVSTKERAVKVAENERISAKRDQKVQEKRDLHTAKEKKSRYQQAQAKTNRAKQ